MTAQDPPHYSEVILCSETRSDMTAMTCNPQKMTMTEEKKKRKYISDSITSHLVVSDHCDVCWRPPRVAMVTNVIVFGTWDPAGGEEERVELHAQRLLSHVLDWQLAANRDEREKQREILIFESKEVSDGRGGSGGRSTQIL